MRRFTMLLVAACCSLPLFAQDRTDLPDIPELAVTRGTEQAAASAGAQTLQNA